MEKTSLKSETQSRPRHDVQDGAIKEHLNISSDFIFHLETLMLNRNTKNILSSGEKKTTTTTKIIAL